MGLGPAVPLEMDAVAGRDGEVSGCWYGAPMAYYVGRGIVDWCDIVVAGVVCPPADGVGRVRGDAVVVGLVMEAVHNNAEEQRCQL